MPKIQDLIKPLKGYTPVTELPKPPVNSLVPDSPISPYSRCPVPQIGNASSDSLDQSDRNGTVPQFRVFLK
jgi:hypothetical protein